MIEVRRAGGMSQATHDAQTTAPHISDHGALTGLGDPDHSAVASPLAVGSAGATIMPGGSGNLAMNLDALGTGQTKIAPTSTGAIIIGHAAGGNVVMPKLGIGTVQTSGLGVVSSSALNLGDPNYTAGTLAAGNGGTGRNVLAANNVLLGDGANAVQQVAPGAAGNVLTSDGATWLSQSPSGGADSDKFLLPFLEPGTTVIGTAEPAGIISSNIGTAFKWAGQKILAKLDGYTTIRLMVDVAGVGTGGLVIEVWDNLSAVSLVTLTIAADAANARTQYETTAAIALTGVKSLSARIKGTVATDDPVWHGIVGVLEK